MSFKLVIKFDLLLNLKMDVIWWFVLKFFKVFGESVVVKFKKYSSVMVNVMIVVVILWFERVYWYLFLVIVIV